MVRVWLRPCLSALNVASRVAPSSRTHLLAATRPAWSVRSLSTKGKDAKGLNKPKTLSSKLPVDDDDDDWQALGAMDPLDETPFDDDDDLLAEDVDDIVASDGSGNAKSWAAAFERDNASIDDEMDLLDEDEDVVSAESVLPQDPDDFLDSGEQVLLYNALKKPVPSQLASKLDRYGAMPEGRPPRGIDVDFDAGDMMSPEMLNHMLPEHERKPFSKPKQKPWTHYVKANHQDIVELALDTKLLELYISPTGQIRPRRFTGLTAKQQRKVARAIKISRQLALLPYLSRYPEPTPDEWKMMIEEQIMEGEWTLENIPQDYTSVDDDKVSEFDDE